MQKVVGSNPISRSFQRRSRPYDSHELLPLSP
jgi:hypothetical protein